MPLVPRTAIAFLSVALAVAALAAPATASGIDPLHLVGQVRKAVENTADDPNAAVQDPQQVVTTVLDPEEGSDDAPGGPKDQRDPGFADRIAAAFDDTALVAGFATVLASVIGLGSFALVTRYISPKEALKNPQRAMLYGFVRGNPGVHLKKLSEEFAMKTSSILWHIRKLESAELVRSERANGFRVFYPVEGGIEMKRVSRAITALQNPNARILFETLERRGGVSPQQLAHRLSIHAGTVRWHLRKLRDFGLVEELVRDEGSQVFATPLGRKALQTLVGVPVEMPRPIATPLPVFME
ncbi:MAG TPA: helix-turn-helix domain-containing protein [Candidatus Thermoplasmatota archaeon]|nr:helix-turn-helix domain-containing protein [Candidatus Thermoplasmatota archaeon]